jgi:hypothetical protein
MSGLNIMVEPTDRVLAIRRAAVAFANDYGPLPAANQGDEAAQHAIAHQLFKLLAREGLHIIYEPKDKVMA